MDPRILIDRRALEPIVAEVRWLQRHLTRIEFAMKPVVGGIRAALK